MQIAENEKWQKGDWEYTWNANGSLRSVKLPNGDLVQYEYDALGRRTKKIVNNKIIRYLWDNNVLLHEWEYNADEQPRKIINKLGEISFDKKEPINNLITWVYETGSFVPCAKIIGNETFSIINDYIGRPILAFNEKGEKVWQTDYDIYGGLRNLKGEKDFIPFRQLGQYEDVETGLYYNRFRYYSPETGLYISKDPISILGGLNVYAYVQDINRFVDIFGLNDCDIAKVKKLVEQIPDKYKKVFMCVEFSESLKKLMQKENISGELLELKTISNKGIAGNIWSDKLGSQISTNGIHKAIKVDDIVFDNLNIGGAKISDWISDLHSPLGHNITGIKF